MKDKTLNEKETAVIVAVLREIDRELQRCYWNKNQKSLASPFDNTGNKYSTPTFSVWAYDWNSDFDKLNFYYPKDNFMVYWYKYLGRGVAVTVPKNWTMDKLPDMLDNCLRAIRENFEK